MITEISSSSKTVTISPEGPTIMIGERINPTARKKLGEALMAGDLDMVRREAMSQVEAGAQVLDLNVGYPGVDEPRMVQEAVRAIAETVDVPICLDSANPEVMKAALEVYKGKILLSSVTGEERRMSAILPLVKRYGTAVVALAMGDAGIPADPLGRLEIVRRIVERAESLGIPREDIIVDCACMTVATDTTAAAVTLETVRLVRKELDSNITLGASNVSFGLPERKTLNAAYLAMLLAAGVNCPIVDPTAPEIAKAILASDLLLGKDEYALTYIEAFRARQAGEAVRGTG